MILKLRNPVEKFAQLRASSHPQAQFLWACFRDLFHYSACHLADIADTARDVDFAIRWGFGGCPATSAQQQAAIAAGLNPGNVWATILFIK